MYDIVRRTDFKNPSDYEVCKKRMFDEIPNKYLEEFGSDDKFTVDVPETDVEVICDVEDIFGDFSWNDINA